MSFMFTPGCSCGTQDCPPLIPDCELLYDGYPTVNSNEYVTVDNLSTYDDGIGNRYFEVRFSNEDNTIYFHHRYNNESIDNYRFCLVSEVLLGNTVSDYYVWFVTPKETDQHGNAIYHSVFSKSYVAVVYYSSTLYPRNSRPSASNFTKNQFGVVNFDDFYTAVSAAGGAQSVVYYQCFVLPFNEEINPCDYHYGDSVVVTKKDTKNDYFKTITDCGFAHNNSCLVSEYCDICNSIVTAKEFTDWLDSIEPENFAYISNAISIILIGFDEEGIVGEYNAITWAKLGNNVKRLSPSRLAQHNFTWDGIEIEQGRDYTPDIPAEILNRQIHFPNTEYYPCASRVCFGTDNIDNSAETSGDSSVFPNLWRITNNNESRNARFETRFPDVTNDNSVRFNGYYWVYALCKPCSESYDLKISAGRVEDLAIARYIFKYSEKTVDTQSNKDIIPIVFEYASDGFSVQEWTSSFNYYNNNLSPLYIPYVWSSRLSRRVATDMSILVPDGKTVGKVFWRAFKDFVSFNSSSQTYHTLNIHSSAGGYIQLNHSSYNETGNKAIANSYVTEEQATQRGFNRFKKSVAGTSYLEFTDNDIRRIVLTMDEDTVKLLLPERASWSTTRSSKTSDETCYIRFPIQYFVIWENET